jgi:hypothetical protein
MLVVEEPDYDTLSTTIPYTYSTQYFNDHDRPSLLSKSIAPASIYYDLLLEVDWILL